MSQRIALALSASALAVAVFVGTPLSHAAWQAVLPPKSVGTTQLKRNSVGTLNLKRSAVTSNKVKNRSLLAVDFALGQLPKGDQGGKGDKGDKGDPGAAGAVSTVKQRTVSQNVGDGTYSRLTATCSSGEKAVGGGVGTTSTATDVSIRESKPTSGGLEQPSGDPFTSWTGALLNAAGGVATAELQVWVVCVT